MKQAILATPFAQIIMAVRDKTNIMKAAIGKSETLGTLINDELSTFLVTNLCDANKTFIDVGAHIGSIISAVHKHNKSIKIIAVEAIPEKAKKLRETFPYAQIHQCAVGDQEGEVEFYINTRQSGFSSLKKVNNNGSQDFSAEIRVPITLLDKLVSVDNIDVIKIDVEGFELEVLSGSKRIIDNNRPVIMFESSIGSESDWVSRRKQIWSLLTEHQYELSIPNRVAHDCPKLSLDTFIESHYYPRITTNYFAIPSERRIEIRDKARKIQNINVG